MGSQPSIADRGWLRAGRVLALGLLSLVLAGQGREARPAGVQALPALPPPVEPAAPLDLGELLPLRPAPLDAPQDHKEPLRIRGRDVANGPGGWTLEDGAVEGKDLLLLADRIEFHQASGEMEAQGHIRLEGPGVRMRCERLRMDWNQQLGEAWTLELELPPNWVLRSAKVEFNTLKHWEFDQVELSPCPEEKPGWKALVSKLTVDLDHYAHLRNLWIWVFNLPTYYFLPWAIYPAKAERTSGVLPVSMAFSGAMGASLSIPYYQVLGPTADFTVTPRYYSKEGIMWGGDLRWNPEPTHKGELAGELINQRTDDQRRYRFNLKELWQREDGWQFTADLNRASDTLLDTDYGSGIARLGQNAFDSATYLGKNLRWGNINVAAAQQTSYFLPNDPFYRSDFPTSMRRENLPSLQATVYPLPLGSFYLDGGLRFSRLGYNLDLGPQSTVDLAASKFVWGRDDAFLHLAGRLGQWGPLRTDLQSSVRFTHYSATLATSFYDISNASNGSLDPNVNASADPFVVTGPPADRLLGSASLLFSAPPVGRVYPQVSLFGMPAKSSTCWPPSSPWRTPAGPRPRAGSRTSTGWTPSRGWAAPPPASRAWNWGSSSISWAGPERGCRSWTWCAGSCPRSTISGPSSWPTAGSARAGPPWTAIWTWSPTTSCTSVSGAARTWPTAVRTTPSPRTTRPATAPGSASPSSPPGSTACWCARRGSSWAGSSGCGATTSAWNSHPTTTSPRRASPPARWPSPTSSPACPNRCATPTWPSPRRIRSAGRTGSTWSSPCAAWATCSSWDFRVCSVPPPRPRRRRRGRGW